MWQLGGQVLPRSQASVLAWVENSASVGSCDWQGTACLQSARQGRSPTLEPPFSTAQGQALLSIPLRNQVIIASSPITLSFLPSQGGSCLWVGKLRHSVGKHHPCGGPGPQAATRWERAKPR